MHKRGGTHKSRQISQAVLGRINYLKKDPALILKILTTQLLNSVSPADAPNAVSMIVEEDTMGKHKEISFWISFAAQGFGKHICPGSIVANPKYPAFARPLWGMWQFNCGKTDRFPLGSCRKEYRRMCSGRSKRTFRLTDFRFSERSVSCPG